MENSQNTNQQPEQPIQTMETPENSQPTQTPQPILTAEKESGSIGPMIASVIIIILIVVGGIYFWGAVLNDSGYVPQDDSEIVEDDAKTNELNEQGTSDDVADIEADLEATNVDNLEGGELDTIEASF